MRRKQSLSAFQKGHDEFRARLGSSADFSITPAGCSMMT